MAQRFSNMLDDATMLCLKIGWYTFLGVSGIVGFLVITDIFRRVRMSREAGLDQPLYEVQFTRKDRVRYPPLHLRLRAFDADDACLRVAEHYQHWPLTISKVRQVGNAVQCPKS